MNLKLCPWSFTRNATFPSPKLPSKKDKYTLSFLPPTLFQKPWQHESPGKESTKPKQRVFATILNRPPVKQPENRRSSSTGAQLNRGIWHEAFAQQKGPLTCFITGLCVGVRPKTYRGPMFRTVDSFRRLLQHFQSWKRRRKMFHYICNITHAKNTVKPNKGVSALSYGGRNTIHTRFTDGGAHKMFRNLESRKWRILFPRGFYVCNVCLESLGGFYKFFRATGSTSNTLSGSNCFVAYSAMRHYAAKCDNRCN